MIDNGLAIFSANFEQAIAAGKYQNAQDFLNDFKQASPALNTGQ